jgi:hypothetical protein
VILFILDGLPFVERAVSHVRKIRLVESIVASVRRIYANREAANAIAAAADGKRTNDNDDDDDFGAFVSVTADDDKQQQQQQPSSRAFRWYPKETNERKNERERLIGYRFCFS